jgi:hypothetical protein
MASGTPGGGIKVQSIAGKVGENFKQAVVPAARALGKKGPLAGRPERVGMTGKPSATKVASIKGKAG